MPDRHQKRLETYLELDSYIEELQAGRVVHLPAQMTMEQIQIYRMAALFCSAAPGAAEPSADFANALYRRLQEIEQEAKDDRPFHATGAASSFSQGKQKGSAVHPEESRMMKSRIAPTAEPKQRGTT